jgi:hypothetical protein
MTEHTLTTTDETIRDGYGLFSVLLSSFEFGECVNIGFNEFVFPRLEKTSHRVAINCHPNLSRNGTYLEGERCGWAYVRMPSGSTEKVFLGCVATTTNGAHSYRVKG